MDNHHAFPLSPGQRALWFVYTLSPGRCAYNINLAWVLPPGVNLPFLKTALKALTARHPCLRTTYAANAEGVLRQTVHKKMPLVFEEERAPHGSESALKNTLKKESHKPLDLENGPVSRWKLFKRDRKKSVLFFSIHHIATDYTSIVKMLKDLSRWLSQGEIPSVKTDGHPGFKAFVTDLASRTTGARGEKLEAYWKQQLQECNTFLNLPLDKERPLVPNYRGDQCSFSLPGPLLDRITRLARENGITRYTFFLSAFTVLLHRYTARDTVLVSSPVSSRTPKFKNLNGYCVNPVALKATFIDDPGTIEFLKRMNKRVFAAIYHKDYPFSALNEILRPARDPGIPAVTQAVYSHIDLKKIQGGDTPLIDLSADGTVVWKMGDAQWEQVDLRGQTDGFDIVLETVLTEDRALLHLMYNENLFRRETVQRMGRHYCQLLASMAQNPEAKVSRLSMLSDKETRTLLSTWGTATDTFDKTACFPAWFEEQARLTPDATALYFGKDTVIFRDLEKRANQVAHYIKKKGVGTESLVGICMDRSPMTVACLLAVLKCGAAYVPLDPHYPKTRLAYIIEDAGLHLILTRHVHKNRVAQARNRVICLDREEKAIDNEPTTPPDRDVQLDNACYVIYTSGSTGHPKGVVIEHRGLCALINSYAQVFGTEELSGVLASVSLNFDLSVMDLLIPLALGGAVVLADHPMSVPFLPAKDRIRLIIAVPSTIRGLLRVNGIPESVSTVAMGGDYLKKDLVEAVYALGHVKRVLNMYGPTEETVWATYSLLSPDLETDPPIGRLLAKTQGYILDQHLRPVPRGIPGELHLGGVGLARGYLNRPGLTREKFIPHPFRKGERLYKTGDLAVFLPDRQIKYLGRIDFQVKIRGFRIELQEIEAVLQGHPHVNEAVVVVTRDSAGENVLSAYAVPDNRYRLSPKDLRNLLKDRLPSHMVPTYIRLLDILPLNPNGKIDRSALPRPETSPGAAQPAEKTQMPGTSLSRIMEIWKAVLDTDAVGIHDNFFDIGGHSLLMVSVFSKLKKVFGTDLSLVDLYRYTTVKSLADFIDKKGTPHHRDAPLGAPRKKRAGTPDHNHRDIAVIGMACRFPGAPDKDTFWHNIKNKVESITCFTEEELKENGVPSFLRHHKNYIPKSGWIEDLECFDADFFRISPGEARIIDPQHRIFLELAWTALEDAGIDIDRTDDVTGVYAGCGQNAYFTNHLNRDEKLREQMGDFNLMIGNGIDFLTSRIGYKFNLTGPMPTVQTACSTSMTGVHLACEGLMHHDCDIALAGGISLGSLKKGYVYQDGMILSANGQCRPFDRDASGTVPSQGAGIVVLKRLADAVRERHHIYAVITGTAINSDGTGKAGFTAPSVTGQATVIRAAQKMARVTPDRISYIEAHGTGTNVGDPIETAALETVFSGFESEKGACAIGAVKGNIGHPDIASGVAGIIKTALALKYRQLPPTLNFETPNSHIKFTDPPFYINTRLKPWATPKLPRRAGVSSFGLGGNNAHTIMEEYRPPFLPKASGPQLLTLSAKTPGAFFAMAKKLGGHLYKHPKENLADVAYTLQKGRKRFPLRQFIVADSTVSAIDKLMEIPGPEQADTGPERATPGVVFMFTGQGAQYPGMGKFLYHQEPLFRKAADQCMALLARIDTTLFHELKNGRDIWDTDRIYDTHITHPALFIFEYALAKLFIHLGIRPDYMIGHSLGEYAAACVARIFSLKDALTAVVARGHLIRGLPEGKMASVALPEEDTQHLLPDGISVAAVNTPGRTVVSGPVTAMDAFEDLCRTRDIPFMPLKTAHAFHSAMLDPIAAEFRSTMERLGPRSFDIPLVSNVTGTWLTPGQAKDPQYWVDHMRCRVRFSTGLTTLFEKDRHMIFLEMGPGRVLSSLALQHPKRLKTHAVLQTVQGPKQMENGRIFLLNALGRLWTRGLQPNWDILHQGRPELTPLPTYPFQRKRYWVDPALPRDTPAAAKASFHVTPAEKKENEPKGTALSRPATPAGSTLENAVIRIWKNFLGLENIAVTDDFFELGGDSLMAVIMVARVKKELGVNLTPNILIKNSTVTQLVAAIREHRGAIQSTPRFNRLPKGVVELKRGKPYLPPLFLCHPNPGYLYFYTDLVKTLNCPNTVFGIEAKGLNGNCAPLDTVEAIAQYHLERITAVRAKGPYLLGGSSFGGMVAFETAQTLLEKGEEVRLLYMVDTPGPGHMMPPFTSNAQVLSQLFAEEFKTDPGFEAQLLKREHNVDAQIEYIVENARSRGRTTRIPPGFGAHVVNMARTYVNAMQQYRPRPYPGHLLFFTQRECLDGYPAFPELAWLPLAQKGAGLHTVPGNHFTMNFYPNVRVLAQALDRYIPT